MRETPEDGPRAGTPTRGERVEIGLPTDMSRLGRKRRAAPWQVKTAVHATVLTGGQDPELCGLLLGPTAVQG